MMTAYCTDRNIKITVAYLSQTSLSLENGFTAFINPSSASPNNGFKEYASLPHAQIHCLLLVNILLGDNPLTLTRPGCVSEEQILQAVLPLH